MDASAKDKDDDKVDGTSVGENGDDSNANNDSLSIGDEKAIRATDKDNNDDASMNDKDDDADGTSVRKNGDDSNNNDNKNQDNASASKEDDDTQETRGNDEEAGPNDEGDSNVASNTVHDNKVVTSGDNGGIIRVREDDSNADNNSVGSGDEEAAGNDDNEGDGKISASLGILPILKNCRDSVIVTGNMAITEKDRNNANANNRDDDAVGPIDTKQGTCGGDEEARTDDEGDGNVEERQTGMTRWSYRVKVGMTQGRERTMMTHLLTRMKTSRRPVTIHLLHCLMTLAHLH
jgi:hypothetical protein